MRKHLIATTFAALTGIGSATAEGYPTKLITFVVPFAAGGPLDSLARAIAEPMSADLGQQIVIENIAGAGGSIGVGRVVHAAPDGHTVGVGNWSTHVRNGAIYSRPPTPMSQGLTLDLSVSRDPQCQVVSELNQAAQSCNFK